MNGRENKAVASGTSDDPFAVLGLHELVTVALQDLLDDGAFLQIFAEHEDLHINAAS